MICNFYKVVSRRKNIKNLKRLSLYRHSDSRKTIIDIKFQTND